MLGQTALAFVCAAIAVAASVVDARVLTFSTERNVVKVGERIALTCTYETTTGVQHINKHHNTIIHRLSTGETIESEREDVEGAHFNLTSSTDGNVKTVTLSLNHASLGDAGNYSCSVQTGSNIDRKFLLIYVEDEPDTIKLYLDDVEISNSGNQVPVKFLKAYTIRCETSGSNPGANISITYGSANVSHINVTSGKAIYLYDLRDPNYAYVIPVERNTTALVKHWVPEEYVQNLGSQVVCLAKVGKDAAGISTAFTPSLAEDAPVFECNDTVYAKDKQKNFVITCQVISHPTLRKASFSATGKVNFTIDGSPFNVTRQNGTYKGLVQVISRVKSNMSLTIESVDINAKIKVSFKAENNIGPTVHSVTILDAVRTSLGSSFAAASLTILFLSLATALFIQQ